MELESLLPQYAVIVVVAEIETWEPLLAEMEVLLMVFFLLPLERMHLTGSLSLMVASCSHLRRAPQ